MRILLLSAYDAQSHCYWREGLVKQFPDVHWTVLSLAPRYFRYRVRSNPMTWIADKLDLLQSDYDAVIATSMVDIATLRGLVPSLAMTPLWLYCHENQFSYPVSVQKRHSASHDLEAKMVFFYACLAADQISFNSMWNRNSALSGLRDLLQRFPERINPSILDEIVRKSNVLPVPLQPLLAGELPVSTSLSEHRLITDDKPLRLLWNHRWEYDKGPDILLALVSVLHESGMVCELNIVGQQFRKKPEAFSSIDSLLATSSTLQRGYWGYVESRLEYQQLLRQCDVVISTALHDFQGLSVLEAVQAGCVPLLPDHMVYPEIFADNHLYTISRHSQLTASSICQRIMQWQQQGLPSSPDITSFEWPRQRQSYQQQMALLL